MPDAVSTLDPSRRSTEVHCREWVAAASHDDPADDVRDAPLWTGVPRSSS
ncbi:hypothetical protein [Modestobacter excelsi]|nr:hypothetical protein [Modestobacter excelsi]